METKLPTDGFQSSLLSPISAILVPAPSLTSYQTLFCGNFTIHSPNTSYILTKLNEEVGSLCFVYFMAMLLAEVRVEVFKVAEG